MTFVEKFNIRPKKIITVLVAPLDWGLGHASRCIPVIKHLSSIGCVVVIAAEGTQRSLLEAEFPHFKFEHLNGYRITFSKSRVKTLIKILRQIPKILISINQEGKWLSDFVAKNKIDVIISDNRYGLFSSHIKSVFITHQLTIKTPFGSFFENLLRNLNYHYIKRYAECWVPDYQDSDNMGGELSHPHKMPAIPVKFLGRLSRIVEEDITTQEIQLLIILSGPEPQRSIFEKIVLSQLYICNIAAVLVRGLPANTEILTNNHKDLFIYNHLSSESLGRFINQATFIISRPGYSTVMDLMGLQKKCIFIPTPGQSEQEYLAKYLSSKKFCLSYEQSKLDVDRAINEAASYNFASFRHSGKEDYKKVISQFIDSLST